jgi:hypothetical protein
VQIKNTFAALTDHDEEEGDLPELESEFEDMPELVSDPDECLAPGWTEVGKKKERSFGKRIHRKDWVKMSKDKRLDIMAVEGETDKKGVRFKDEVKGVRMTLGFQVADVKKPLIAVKRIVEKGNAVAFGPSAEDNYIENKQSGNRIPLRPNGKGSYLMDVLFVGGGKTEITVDSGAEESICPWWWGEHFPVRPADEWLQFRNASGGFMEHYGQRSVEVTSPF